MNNFKIISAVILAICTAAAILSSCVKTDELKTNISSTAVSDETETVIITDNKGETVIQTKKKEVTVNNATPSDTADPQGDIAETITEKQAVTVKVTDKKGNVSVSVSEKIVTVPAKTTKQPVTADKNAETKATTASKPATTKRAVSNDAVEEKAVGISLLSKSDPVETGNHATVIVQGTPGKTYSIEFYESPSRLANYSALEEKKADANGFVSWSFKVRNTCDLGTRKVIIKENNSTNYLQTSITIK